MDTDTANERDGIVEMRRLIKEFLTSENGSLKVREYIASVAQDDTLLQIYLKGRKYKADYAWETLKRYAEVRFDEYPEVFPDDTHDTASQIKTLGVMAMLKSRDEFGRRIVYLNGEKWNPDKISFDLITTFGVYFTEKELFDDDVMTNGIILIHNCSGMGFKHARMYTLHNMLKWLNIYWRARPLKVGELYFINVPSFAVYPVKLIKPFFSKKLKEKFIVSTRDKKFETLHEKLSPDLLPKCLGGTLDDDEAFDWEFLQFKK
ncbi:Retinaldehyde-binding protein 1 [Orchesella cincta]|uniref:Retinaldehyde-binding protein 1 n=1 Tax=Orchesella cincta TaxID=48709 RepID=A0A1D2MMQ4_ORCCI|nr:Retinaldehyde-binding protein 1 [Orchesella cincta]